jgi:methyl-accepting chemotaxis protein
MGAKKTIELIEQEINEANYLSNMTRQEFYKIIKEVDEVKEKISKIEEEIKKINKILEFRR